MYSSTSSGAEKVADSFLAGKSMKRGNAVTDGRVYKLFGNTIARRDNGTAVDRVTARLLNEPLVELSDGCHATPTTKRHLRAIFSSLGRIPVIYISDFQLHINGCPFDAGKFYDINSL